MVPRTLHHILLILLSGVLVDDVAGLGTMSRRQSVQQILQSVPWSSIVVLEPQEIEVAPLEFSGVYRDPTHPDGYRVVRSAGPGRVSVSAQDYPNGQILRLAGTRNYDPKNKKTNLSIEVPGKDQKLLASYSPDQLLYVNFCEKGEVLSRGSITFTDGTVWVKDNGPSGVYVDSKYPDGYRMVREVKNAKFSIEKADRLDQVPVILPAVIN